jgi:exosome complex RNA-binding protein Rrp42 (RNase PH superfamily)
VCVADAWVLMVHRPSDELVHVARMVERAVRQSRAIDTEALCVVPGVRVWAVRVDVHVIDAAGNTSDCACAAALAALHHARRPAVSVQGDRVIIVRACPCAGVCVCVCVLLCVHACTCLCSCVCVYMCMCVRVRANAWRWGVVYGA